MLSYQILEMIYSTKVRKEKKMQKVVPNKKKQSNSKGVQVG